MFIFSALLLRVLSRSVDLKRRPMLLMVSDLKRVYLQKIIDPTGEDPDPLIGLKKDFLPTNTSLSPVSSN